MVGIDQASDGLARAKRLGVPATHEGRGLVKLPNFKDIRIAFDATSAGSHAHHNEVLQRHGVQMIDLTPGGDRPYVIRWSTWTSTWTAQHQHGDMRRPGDDVRWCARMRVARVHYGEIVASIASKSPVRARAPTSTSSPRPRPGPSSRGGAPHAAKPDHPESAEPPLIMRDTFYCLARPGPTKRRSGRRFSTWWQGIQPTMPGYRLKQEVQFDRIAPTSRSTFPAGKLHA